jgi:hypothetical protein
MVLEKSRCIYEILKSKITNFQKIHILNPKDIPTTTDTAHSTISISELVSELKKNDGNDLIIWHNFPDDLEDGQNPQRGQEALVKISSASVKNLLVSLKPNYRELYRGIASRIPEIEDKEIVYDREKIREIVESYGSNLTKFDNLKTVEDQQIKLTIMTANNQYAGFGPGTVNIFRNMIGLPEAKWEEKEEGGEAQKHLEEYPAIDSKQRTLSDFIN